MVKTTHVGSLPFINISEAIEFNKQFSLPVLSSLPNMDSSEFMINQISTGIVGSSVKNFKIITEKLEFVDNFKLNFLMLNEFKNTFKGRIVKWQIMGPITFIKTFNKLLSNSEKKVLLNWYDSLLLNFFIDHKDSFKEMILVLDEPLFDPSLKKYLVLTIDSLKSSNFKIGIHCCCKLNISDIEEIKLDYLSIDCSLYNKDELIRINNLKVSLISGVVDTVSGEVSCSMIELIKESEYFSPTCGLAFSSLKVCHKALSNLSLL